MTKEDNQIHKSVLLQESIRGLEVKSGEIFLDCTLGAGGHSLFVAKETNNKAIIIGIDADGKALESAGEKIKNAGAEFYGFNGNFRNLDQALDKNKIQLVDKVLFDFGLSSDQLDESGRGFSFRFNEPLLMTLKDTPAENDLTASDVVNGFEQKNLEDIIRGFGEEQFAGRIARVIVERRQEKPIETTFELAEIITEAIPARFRKGKIHPATKTFQAIRMAVNGELDAIGEGLEKAFERLNKKQNSKAIF